MRSPTNKCWKCLKIFMWRPVKWVSALVMASRCWSCFISCDRVHNLVIRTRGIDRDRIHHLWLFRNLSVLDWCAGDVEHVSGVFVRKKYLSKSDGGGYSIFFLIVYISVFKSNNVLWNMLAMCLLCYHEQQKMCAHAVDRWLLYFFKM